jgi:hypothetical protein
MHRAHRSIVSTFTLGVLLAIGCATAPTEVPEDDDDDDNNGGTGPTGGFSGTPATGGNFPQGGSFPQGGTPASGGTPAAGGTPASGGTPAAGGTPASGGTPAAGGSLPTGGVSGAGISGAAGVAGTPGAGGTGSTATCDAAFAVGADGFVRAPGVSGCWHGYAYSGGDTGSTLTTMTSFAMCGMPCMLRVAGTLGPATAENAYIGSVYLGFNVAQPAGSTTFTTLTPTGTSLQVTYTKTAGPATIRVQIQAGANRWCAPLTASPATIPYAMFNTACWDNSGTAYTKQPIEAVQLVAPGEMTAVPLDVTLVSVKEL